MAGPNVSGLEGVHCILLLLALYSFNGVLLISKGSQFYSCIVLIHIIHGEKLDSVPCIIII